MQIFQKPSKTEKLRTLLVLPIHKFATVFTVVMNYFPQITGHLEMPTIAHTHSHKIFHLWNPKVHYHNNSLPSYHIQSQIRTVCTIILYFFTISFILIPSIPRPVNWCFTFRSLQFGILCSSLPYLLHDLATTCSIPSSKHSIWWSKQITKNAIYSFILTSYYFLPAKLKYSP